MNLYIIESVLYDYTSGMVCIAAESIEQCRELFIQEFAFGGTNKVVIKEFDDAIKANEYKVLKVMNQKAEVVSYVYGGS